MKDFVFVRKPWSAIPLERRYRFSMALGNVGLTRNVCLLTFLSFTFMGLFLFIWSESEYWPSMYLLFEAKLGLNVGAVVFVMASIALVLTMGAHPYLGKFAEIEYLGGTRVAAHLS